MNKYLQLVAIVAVLFIANQSFAHDVHHNTDLEEDWWDHLIDFYGAEESFFQPLDQEGHSIDIDKWSLSCKFNFVYNPICFSSLSGC